MQTFQDGLLFDGALFVLNDHWNIGGYGDHGEHADQGEQKASGSYVDVVQGGARLISVRAVYGFHHVFFYNRQGLTGLGVF